MTKATPQVQRFRARRLAMQALYQWHFNPTDGSSLVKELLDGQGEKRIDREYFEAMVMASVQRMEELDAVLTPLLDRPMAQLDPVEQSILRLAVCEFMERLDVPYRVVINEAVELAKQFGAQDGYKFVNAVLDKAAVTLRAIECQAHRDGHA